MSEEKLKEYVKACNESTFTPKSPLTCTRYDTGSSFDGDEKLTINEFMSITKKFFVEKQCEVNRLSQRIADLEYRTRGLIEHIEVVDDILFGDGETREEALKKKTYDDFANEVVKSLGRLDEKVYELQKELYDQNKN